MAERRMFARSIVESDAFLDMPLSARCLYFALGMGADDDGFIGNPKSVMRQASATQDDLKLLIAKRFVLSFESGVIVIKHWRINNYLRNDRYKPTTYVEELKTLALDDKGAYTEKRLGIPSGIPLVYQMDTQYSIGKNSIGKVSEEEDSLLKILKNRLSSAGAYTGVFDELIDEILEALVAGTKIENEITLNGAKYDARTFERIADHITFDQVAKVANRLLQRKGEIQNREKYIQCMLAECFGIGDCDEQ